MYCCHAGAGEDAWEVIGGALAVRRPVLLATERELAVLADGGVSLVAMLPLAGVPFHHLLSAVTLLVPFSEARRCSTAVSHVPGQAGNASRHARYGQAAGAGWACHTAMRGILSLALAPLEHACHPACPQALLWHAGLRLVERFGERSLSARTAAGRCAALHPGSEAGPCATLGLRLSARLDDAGWLLLLPQLRLACSRA